MNYNFNARGIYFSLGFFSLTECTEIYRCAMVFAHKFHKYHEYLSLCDGFLDVLEELGRCAVLDFVILVFRQGMVAFGILICKDNNFF